jgi:hypothetical protein
VWHMCHTLLTPPARSRSVVKHEYWSTAPNLLTWSLSALCCLPPPACNPRALFSQCFLANFMQLTLAQSWG